MQIILLSYVKFAYTQIFSQVFSDDRLPITEQLSSIQINKCLSPGHIDKYHKSHITLLISIIFHYISIRYWDNVILVFSNALGSPLEGQDMIRFLDKRTHIVF